MHHRVYIIILHRCSISQKHRSASEQHYHTILVSIHTTFETHMDCINAYNPLIHIYVVIDDDACIFQMSGQYSLYIGRYSLCIAFSILVYETCNYT